ncbi:uncharacterized protein LOC110244788 isoform X2 [Exaiptasia diaphana]|uniref:Death domain-containing protein n=1 Tax=Exaiptasia diaphana TaxID=2652724 RepID=A0A913XLD4_EXADI|nr:uncharacterized protein LOC110244788 isoform X2 [Exaiptasia diaphana]
MKGLKVKLLPLVTIIASCTITCPSAEEIPCLHPSEIKVCDSNYTVCFCRPCLSCPPGFGQNLECGKIIMKSQKLKCVPCVVGANYSDDNSSALCRPCGGCDGFKVLKKCTITKPTICSRDTCADGYDFNSDMPDMLVCQKKPTQPTTQVTTQKAKSTDSDSTAPITNSGTLQKATMNDPYKSSTKLVDQDQATTKSSHGHVTIKNIVIAILVLIVVAFIATVLFLKRKKIKEYIKKRIEPKDDSSTPESLPLNVVPGSSSEPSPQLSHQGDSRQLDDLSGSSSEPSPELSRQEGRLLDAVPGSSSEPSQELSQEAYPWPADVLLKSIPHDLHSAIETRISNPKQPGWRELAQELGLDEETILRIDNHYQPEKGYHLFEALKTQKPKLTFTTFVDVLVKLKRVDIVEKAKESYYQDSMVIDVTLEDS